VKLLFNAHLKLFFLSCMHIYGQFTISEFYSSLIPLKNFNNWMDNAIDDLQDTFNIHSIAEVEQLQAEHEEFKANALQEANGRYEELNGYVQQMADMGSTDNPYTTLTPNVSNS